jgi:hypothetical protein
MVSRWTGCLPEKARSQLAKSRESAHSWGAIDLPPNLVPRFILIRRPLLTDGTERNPVAMACALPAPLADNPAHCAAASQCLGQRLGGSTPSQRDSGRHRYVFTTHQESLAKLLALACGIPYAYTQHGQSVRGEKEVVAEILLRISREFGKSLEWLLTGEG